MNKATLGEICDRTGGLIQTGPFGSQLHQSDYRDAGVPVVMPQDIVDDRISDRRIARIDESLAQRLGRHILQKGDIVFPRRGEISKRAIIEDEQVGYLCGTGCLKISVPPVELHPKFLYYFLGQEHVVKWIEGKAVGTTMLNLNTSVLRSLVVDYPEFREQERIAAVLSAYDDLIAINQRRIQLLEESARLLFREWFVRLRFPGHESVPVKDGMPEGWQTRFLSGIADVNRASITAKDRPDTLLYVDISAVTPGEIGEIAEYVFDDAPGRARRKVAHGNIIWSCVRPNRRSYALIWEPDERLIVSTGFAVLTATAVPFSYLYFATTTDEFVGYLDKHATGAAYPAVTGKDFENAPVIVPDKETLEQFDRLVLPLIEQTEQLKLQNKQLRTARDLLLPKLMSGALDVSGIPLSKEVAP